MNSTFLNLGSRSKQPRSSDSSREAYVFGSVSSGDKPNSVVVSLRLVGLPLLPLRVAAPTLLCWI